MKCLAKYITKQLQTDSHCAVYDIELSRVWPRNGKRREAVIAAFAKEHGWVVRHYKDGFVAIFTKEPPSRHL